MSTQWMTSVADLVDAAPDDDHFVPGAHSSVREATITLGDGQAVKVGERGRLMLALVMSALVEGQAVHIQTTESLMTPEQAAEALDVSRPTIYRWQEAGLLPCVLQGKVRAVPADAVAQLGADRDSRRVADRLAAAAAAATAVDATALFTATQEAVRAATPARAVDVWQRRRATAVAEAAGQAAAALRTR